MIIRIIEEQDDVLTYIIFYYATLPRHYNVIELVQIRVFHHKRKKIMLFWDDFKKIVNNHKKLLDQKVWEAKERRMAGSILSVRNYKKIEKMVQDKEEIVEEKEFISYEKAIEMLPEKDNVHTFREGKGPFIVGADWSKEKLLDHMKQFQDTLEFTGETARKMNHGIALRDNISILFIETKEVSS